VFQANLRTRPGGGVRIGTIAPDTVVQLGRSTEEWQEVEVVGPVTVRGWVQRDRLGCRVLRETDLVPLDGSQEHTRLRPGALVAVASEQRGRLAVETRDPVSRRGTIDATTCGIGEPFVPRYPRGATPYRLVREAEMVVSGEGSGSTYRLPEGYRFAVESQQGRAAIGWTDGPVVVRGQVDASSIERDRRSPLDRLGQPLGYTHEAMIDTDLLDARSGRPVASISGGTPVNPIETGADWVKVRTFGKIQLEGWVEAWAVRRVALDHNELEPWARRRAHAPVDRTQPRGTEAIEDDAR
jgi:hypothetical protein